ncbi:type III-B CRISPR module RAMP protein Cmr6 [Ignisphaera sp. 4213-co]|uniref:Type III-B CRISPR module RAMP protein Cmr6 n=1 Tax=Ignisphaera cupida TaxID=3050454 RepID=A0ABD4ZAD9_9CREN|nr:type III-B CRISPR module RAMP protein Cmr6 [Ignisphaera sp. 4213-co]MDK6029523.1 type III-B CRISPR module RAMP protein Cmr6 [Ignisphaera sp. 4213-co]
MVKPAKSSRRVSELRCEAIKKYLSFENLPLQNVVSSVLKAFVDCFVECLDGGCGVDVSDYISFFNRFVTRALAESYKCDRVKHLLNSAREYVARVYTAAEKVFGSAFIIEGELKSRLLIHTKSPVMPLDMGISWDFILNIPFVPASSVKGLARSYFEANKIVVGGLDADELFGSEEGGVGYIVFFDAYPVSCQEKLIEPDVITPHYPGDRIDELSATPTPIVFPAIAPKTVMHFPVAVNVKLIGKKIGGQGLGKEITAIISNIAKALESGVGAKTSVGYGRIKIVKY